MRTRVAITGAGIISSLGNSVPEVTDSLRSAHSGIVAVPEWAELGLASTVAGRVRNIRSLAQASGLDDEQLLSMTEAALFCTLAAQQAVDHAGLSRDELTSERTGCVVGSGISGAMAIHEGATRLLGGQARRVSPYIVLQAMSSSPSASVAHALGIGGRSYSLSSACATSTHSIGHAYELIQDGRLDMVIAGGGEEVNPVVAGAFAAMRTALSTHFNQKPERASRPFAAERDGFVLAEGAGVVVLESWDHAVARGAPIHAEVVGFAANSDRYQMVLPRADGAAAAACMRAALGDAGTPPDDVDYVNAHATSTVAGDLAEAEALRTVFNARMPLISSTKSMNGHALGAAGAHEVIHCLTMLEHGFVAPSINLEPPDPAFDGLELVGHVTAADLELAVSNSFGFGGTNACLVLRRHRQ